MSTATKTYEFPIDVHWVDGRLTRASAAGKHDLDVATPPEFKHGIPGVWSPEDLLVASVATCFAVTLVAIAERRAVPLHGLELGATGTVSQRSDGRFGFTDVVLDVVVYTDRGREDEAASAAEAAERGCLIGASVSFPISLELDVQSVSLQEVTL